MAYTAKSAKARNAFNLIGTLCLAVAFLLAVQSVSPQNVMISEAGAVKVIDFGVAKAIGRELPDEKRGALR